MWIVDLLDQVELLLNIAASIKHQIDPAATENTSRAEARPVHCQILFAVVQHRLLS